MLLTFHCNAQSHVNNVSTFTLNQNYNCKSIKLRRVIICSDASNHENGATQDIVLYGRFVSGLTGTHLTHTNAKGITKTNTFPLGIINQLSGDAYDSGDINYIIGGYVNLNSTISFEFGEFRSQMNMDDPMNPIYTTTFNTTELNLTSNEGSIVLQFEVELENGESINEV